MDADLRAISAGAVHAVYPNPFLNEFKIASAEDVSITLTSLDGARTFKAEVRADESCSPDISPGFYILNIIRKNGECARIKVVKL